MDKRQIGLAAGIAILCGLAWVLGPEDRGQVSEVGALGLIALAVITVFALLRRN